MSSDSVPDTCTKDSDCTGVAGYSKGCCIKYDPGSADTAAI